MRTEHERDIWIALVLGLVMGLGGGAVQTLLSVLPILPPTDDDWSLGLLVALTIGGGTFVAVYLSRRQMRLDDNSSEEEANINALPGWRLRWIHATMLFVLFAEIIVLSMVIRGFEKMYIEMFATVQNLPAYTQWVLKIWHTAPYTLVPSMIALTWFYFTWVAKRLRRMNWFLGICIILFFGTGFFVVISLFMPLIVDMESIGPPLGN